MMRRWKMVVQTPLTIEQAFGVESIDANKEEVKWLKARINVLIDSHITKAEFRTLIDCIDEIWAVRGNIRLRDQLFD